MATEAPKLSKIRLLAAKIETTTGTAIAVTGTDAKFIIMNPVMTSDDPINERELQAGLGQDVGTAGARGGKLTFSTEITGNGASGIAPWASTFLPACDWELTGSTYNAARGVTTLTMALFEDGLKRVLFGARGTFKIRLESGKPGMIDWEFTGKYTDTTDVAILAPTFPTVLAPIFAGATITVGGITPILSRMEFDAGNTVVLREDGTDATAYRSAAITNRKAVGTLDPEAGTVATVDWRSLRVARTAQSVSVAWGGTAHNIITIASTTARIDTTRRGSRNDILTDELNLSFSGSTPFSIAFS